MMSRPPAVWPNAGNGPNLPFGQGAYIEPGRTQHVPEYRLRVDDVLDVVYRRTRDEIKQPYTLGVGDQIRVEMRGQPDITRELDIQPDGTISLPILGSVRAYGRTVDELRELLQERYGKIIKGAQITVTPLLVNIRLQDLLDSVDRRFGQGGIAQEVRVTPDGTIALPALGSVPVQGLTLDELKLELYHRYAAIVEGLDVTPVLRARAPRFVYVLGEVLQPGRFVLEAPTTVTQAIALAGGISTAAASKLKHVVVLRRGFQWELLATKVDIRGQVIGRHVNIHPIDDLWVADSDVIVVPKSEILVVDEYIDLIFTNGIYRVMPFQSSLTYVKAIN